MMIATDLLLSFCSFPLTFHGAAWRDTIAISSRRHDCDYSLVSSRKVKFFYRTKGSRDGLITVAAWTSCTLRDQFICKCLENVLSVTDDFWFKILSKMYSELFSWDVLFFTKCKAFVELSADVRTCYGPCFLRIMIRSFHEWFCFPFRISVHGSRITLSIFVDGLNKTLYFNWKIYFVS